MGTTIVLVWHHYIVQILCGQYVNSILPGWVGQRRWVDYLYAQPLGFQRLGILKITHPPPRNEKYTSKKILEILGWRLKGIYLPKIWFHEGMLRGSQLVILCYPSICIFQASTMTVFVIRRVAMDMLEAVLWRFITCWRERLEDKVSFSAPQHPNPEVNTPVTRYPSQNWSQFELLRRAEALWEVP